MISVDRQRSVVYNTIVPGKISEKLDFDSVQTAAVVVDA